MSRIYAYRAMSMAVVYDQKGERALALQLAQAAVVEEPTNGRAWALLSEMVDNRRDALICLSHAYDLEPASAADAIFRLRAQYLRDLPPQDDANLRDGWWMWFGQGGGLNRMLGVSDWRPLGLTLAALGVFMALILEAAIAIG
jgi:hypothetical protein